MVGIRMRTMGRGGVGGGGGGGECRKGGVKEKYLELLYILPTIILF